MWPMSLAGPFAGTRQRSSSSTIRKPIDSSRGPCAAPGISSFNFVQKETMKRLLITLAAIISISSAASGQARRSALMEKFKAYHYGGDRTVLDEVAACA